MESKKIISIISIGIVFLLSLFLLQQVLTGSGNTLSRFSLYLGIGGFLLGVFKPGVGILFVVVAGFYLDLMKRLLIVDGHVGFIDLVKVLAFAPVTFAGILTGQLLLCLFGKAPFGKREAIAFSVSFILSCVVLTISMVKGGGFTGLAQTGSQVAYISFIWLAFYHLNTPEKRHAFLRFALTAFIPVVLYAYWQLLFGYSDLEYDYALSGLTIVSNPLMEGRVEYYRVFSTMSSSGAYGLMTIVMGSYALIAYKGVNNLQQFMAKAFGLLCYASLIPGAGRTGWAIILIIIVCAFMFRKKSTTALIYGVTAVGLASLFTAGDAIVETGTDLLKDTDRSSAWTERTLTIGTFTSRTDSIKNWTTDPQYFSWFGLTDDQKESTFIHDMLGEVYVGYGLVGLVVVVVSTLLILFTAHLNIFRMKDADSRKFMAFIVAVVFGLLVGSIVSGGGIRIFPVVFYFWAFIGMIWVMVIYRSKQSFEESSTLETEALKISKLSGNR